MDGIDTAGMPLGGPADDGALTYRWRNAKHRSAHEVSAAGSLPVSRW